MSAKMNKSLPHLTTNGKFVNYAVEANSPDGPHVVCLSASLEVALAALETRFFGEDDHGPYIHGTIIPFEAGQEVWLGFPFRKKGAKEAVGRIGAYAEDRQMICITESEQDSIRNTIDEATRSWH